MKMLTNQSVGTVSQEGTGPGSCISTDLMSQSFQPMAVQVSMKAALPLDKSFATVSH